MRLIARTVYRAFPELDRHSDEQCLRFVLAARGGYIRRTIGAAIMVVVGLAGVVAGIAGLVYIMSAKQGRFDPTQPPFRPGTLVGLAAAFVCFAPGPFLAYITRDWFLRRRVRFVLRTRGICHKCWYSLVGLAVEAGNMVRCPECGHDSEVDPSLGELVTDEAGRLRFKPEGSDAHLGSVFWNERRARAIKRIALWGSGGVLALLLATVGGYEIFLRYQARAARAARTAGGATALMEYVKKHQPADTRESSPDAWDELDKAAAILARVDGPAWRNNQPATNLGNRVYPEFSLLHAGPGFRSNWWRGVRDPEWDAACEALARRLLADYGDAGLYEALTRMAACERAVRDVDIFPGRPLGDINTSMRGNARLLAEVCAARAALALQDSDRAEYFDSIESLLALARVSHLQPTVADGLIGDSIEALAQRQLIDMLTATSSPSAPWLDDAATVLARQSIDLPRDYHEKGSLIVAQDTLAWFYSEPSRVRFDRYSPTIEQELGGFQGPGRVGTFVANRDELNARAKAESAQLVLEPFERTQSVVPPSNLLLPDVLRVSRWWRPQAGADQAELFRRGIRVMIALERWKLANGTYPDSLDALVPKHLNAVPLDPWSGRALRYIRVDPADDAFGRAYLLYSVGADGTDQGGKQSDKGRLFVLTEPASVLTAAGDFVINEPEGRDKEPANQPTPVRRRRTKPRTSRGSRR